MSIISPYHDHNMFSHTYFYFLLYPQLKMSVSVWSSSSVLQVDQEVEVLLRGGEKVIVRFLQEIPLVGEWLSGGSEVVVVEWL